MTQLVYNSATGALCTDPDGRLLACCDEEPTFVCGGCPSPDPNFNVRRPRVRIDGVVGPCAEINGRIYTLGNPILGGVNNSQLCLIQNFALLGCLPGQPRISWSTARAPNDLTDMAIVLSGDPTLPGAAPLAVFAAILSIGPCSSLQNVVLPYDPISSQPPINGFAGATATLIGFF